MPGRAVGNGKGYDDAPGIVVVESVGPTGMVVVGTVATVADAVAPGGRPAGLAAGGEPAWLLAHEPSTTAAASSRAALTLS
jgi:hypothetical protein